MIGIFQKIFSSANQRRISAYEKVVKKINFLEEETKKLSEVAYQALFAGLSKVKSGNTLLDVAGAIEDVVKVNGFHNFKKVRILYRNIN